MMARSWWWRSTRRRRSRASANGTALDEEAARGAHRGAAPARREGGRGRLRHPQRRDPRGDLGAGRGGPRGAAREIRRGEHEREGRLGDGGTRRASSPCAWSRRCSPTSRGGRFRLVVHDKHMDRARERIDDLTKAERSRIEVPRGGRGGDGPRPLGRRVREAGLGGGHHPPLRGHHLPRGRPGDGAPAQRGGHPRGARARAGGRSPRAPSCIGRRRSCPEAAGGYVLESELTAPAGFRNPIEGDALPRGEARPPEDGADSRPRCCARRSSWATARRARSIALEGPYLLVLLMLNAPQDLRIRSPGAARWR